MYIQRDSFSIIQNKGVFFNENKHIFSNHSNVFLLLTTTKKPIYKLNWKKLYLNIFETNIRN